MRCTHFIGFKPGTQDWWSAVRVFGRPDFIHRKWDERAAYGGEIDPENDILIFSSLTEWKAYVTNKPMKGSVDDSAVGIPSDEELTRRGVGYGNVASKR